MGYLRNLYQFILIYGIWFWILAHKNKNHKWMFFIGFNGGLASGFSTKPKAMDEAMARLSVYLKIPKWQKPMVFQQVPNDGRKAILQKRW